MKLVFKEVSCCAECPYLNFYENIDILFNARWWCGHEDFGGKLDNFNRANKIHPKCPLPDSNINYNNKDRK